MTLVHKSWKYLGVVALIGFFCDVPRQAWAIIHPTNYRVNHVVGPDAIPATVDDDDPNYDPNDPNDVLPKPQNETTIAVVRGPDGLADKIFAAWNDGSWADHSGSYSIEDSIGFVVSADIHGADPWPIYDLLRSDDGFFQPGHMRPPDCGEANDPNDPNTWSRWFWSQADPVAAVIPPDSGITGVHLVGLGIGTDPPYGCGRTRIFYAASRGHPDTWDPNDADTWHVQTIAFGPPFGVDQPYISVWGTSDDPNDPPGTPKYVCITWTRITQGYRVKCAISTDGGDTFPIQNTLDRQGVSAVTFSASAFAPGPPGGDDPYLYVVWWKYDEGEGVDRIVYRRGVVSDPNQGPPSVTWDPPLGGDPLDPNEPGVVADINHLTQAITEEQLVNFTLIDQPSIVVDHTCARKGWVYVCYASEVPAGLQDPVDPDTPCDPNNCQPDIFVSRYRYDQSPNNVVWDAPVRVNDDDVWLGQDPNTWPMRTVQVMPWIALDDLGHVGVGFYDRRLDDDQDSTPGDWNKLQWYYFAYSSNGAGSFRDNMPVSDPNKPSQTHVGTEVFIGDYTSIAAGNGSFFAAWCDTRNWHSDRSRERSRLGDIYFAEIEIPAGDGVGPDFDADCDVDLDDYGVFASCYNGANRPPAPTCPPGVDSDFDADGDVDLDDFGIFSACYTGSLGGCPWQQGNSAQGSTGGGGAEADTDDDPTIEELYRRLEEYCEENGIPFT